jgi:hypothetical protein
MELLRQLEQRCGTTLRQEVRGEGGRSRKVNHNEQQSPKTNAPVESDGKECTNAFSEELDQLETLSRGE